MVESAVRSSDATVVEERCGGEELCFCCDKNWVDGPAGWEILALSPNIWKDGRDILSMSTGRLEDKSFIVEASFRIHHSKSWHLRSALRSIPSCELGCFAHPNPFFGLLQ